MTPKSDTCPIKSKPIHVFRRHQTNLVALRAEHPPEMVRATAGLHRHDAPRQPLDKPLDRLPPHPAPQHYPAGPVQTHDTANVLAQVNSNNHDAQ